MRDLFKKIDWKKIGLILYLFVIFFSPPIIPSLNIIIPVSVISAFFVAVYYRRELAELYKNTYLQKITLLFVAILTYVVLVLLSTTGVPSFVLNIYRFVMIFPVVFICILFVLCVAKREKYRLRDVFKLALYAVLLQAFLGIVSMMVLPIKTFFVEIMRENTGVVALKSTFHLERRFYGFANDLLDNYGYGMGLAVILPIIIAFFSKKYIWLLGVLPIAVVALMNARTSLFVLAISLPIMIFGFGAAQRFGKKIFAYVALGLMLIGFGTFVLAKVFPKNAASFAKDLDSIASLVFYGQIKPGTTASSLMRYGVKFPDSKRLVFGTGHNVFPGQLSTLEYETDIGYLNDIWMLGLFGSLLVYGSIIYLLSRVGRLGGIYSYIAVSLALSFFVFQIKGPAFKPGFGMIITLFISMVILVFYKPAPRKIDKNHKKVLQVVGALNAGGAENLIVNVYKKLSQEYRFVFLCYLKTDEKYHYEDDIRRLGGKIIRIKDNRIKNPIKFVIDIKKVMEDEKIGVVHSHVDLSSAYALLAAKLAGVEKRVIHSHNSKFSVPKVAQALYKRIIHLLATDRIGVSNDAGREMFGDDRFSLVINGIDVEKNEYSKKFRKEVRDGLGIPQDATVWLNVGRLLPQKNQSKLLKDFAKACKANANSFLIILGEGELLEELKQEASDLNILHKVYFMGRVSDAFKYYSTADLFVMTSKYEGVSLACLEAQANGLPCVMPKNTSTESIVNDNVFLTDDLGSVKNPKRTLLKKDFTRYNVANTAKEIEQMYRDKIKVSLLIDEFFGGANTAYGGYGFLARKYVAKFIPCQDIQVDVLLGLNISRKHLFRNLIGAVFADHNIVDGVNIYRVPWLPIFRKRWLKKMGYDVYLSIELTGTCDYILKSDPGKKLILWIQDPRPKSAWDVIGRMNIIEDHSFYNQRLYDFVNTKALEGGVKFISQGRTLNPLAKELYSLPEETPIGYLPNPIETNDDYKFNIKNKKHIIFLGRLEAQKRCWLFCEIAKRMPDYEFYVIGQFFRFEEDNRATLAKYMDGSVKNLHFVGHLDGEEKKALIQNARLLVSTSVWEGIPISWLEVLSYGTLLVSDFEREGLVERFGEFVGEVEGDGFDQVDLFLPSIKKLMSDNKLYVKKAKEAMDYVRSNHSTDLFVKNLRNIIYKEVKKDVKNR